MLIVNRVIKSQAPKGSGFMLLRKRLLNVSLPKSSNPNFLSHSDRILANFLRSRFYRSCNSGYLVHCESAMPGLLELDLPLETILHLCFLTCGAVNIDHDLHLQGC